MAAVWLDAGRLELAGGLDQITGDAQLAQGVQAEPGGEVDHIDDRGWAQCHGDPVMQSQAWSVATLARLRSA